MDNLQTILQKVNEKISEEGLAFLTVDPERAFGLEGLLENYSIICVEDNILLDYIPESVKVLSVSDQIVKSSARLLKSGKTQEFLKKNNIKNVQTFKISPNFEEYAAVENLNIFNTSSSLNQKFENKISQYEIFENTGVNFPKTLSGKLSEL